MAEVPPSRASDYSLCLSNPFQYYLTRRLGLVPMLSWSEALSAGTWMHERARYFFQSFPNGDLPAELNTELQNQLDDRLTELRAACNTLSISPARENEILEDERRAYALGRAILKPPSPSNSPPAKPSSPNSKPPTATASHSAKRN